MKKAIKILVFKNDDFNHGVKWYHSPVKMLPPIHILSKLPVIISNRSHKYFVGPEIFT